VPDLATQITGICPLVRFVSSPHLSAEELSAYVDGKIDPLARRRLEAHLVRCEECLKEVLAILHYLREWPRPPA
jgi:Putative zinc-finger